MNAAHSNLSSKKNESIQEKLERFLGIGIKEKRTPLPKEDRERIYKKADTFAQFIPTLRYEDNLGVFVMDDEISVGVALEVTHIGAEDVSITDNFDQHEKLLSVFENLPEREVNPYVVACYSQEEPLNQILKESLDYAKKQSKSDDSLMKDYCDIQTEHFHDISNEKGLFREGLANWRGVNRRTRVLLYRKFDENKERNLVENAKEMRLVLSRVVNGLNSAGVESREFKEDGLYKWLNPWFSNEKTTNEKYDKVVSNPFKRDTSIEGVPDYETDILDWILDSSSPESGSPEPEDGTWKWGNEYVRFVPVVGSKNRPLLGQITTTATLDKKASATNTTSKRPLFFRLPQGTIYSLIMVITTQENQQDKLAVISKSARANSREGLHAREMIEPALTAMVKGHKLYPIYHGFYIRNKTKEGCLDSVRKAIAEITTDGFRCIKIEDDIHALDEAVRTLPFAYDPELDKYLMRQYPLWLHDIVSLLPLWGQSAVNGSPCTKFFDRLGKPIIFDMIEDKRRVAHMFLGGATGAGKSALLNYQLWEMYCIHRPRNFIVDYGGSYKLLAEYFISHGITVKYSKCSPKNPAKFALFGDAKQYLYEVSGQNALDGETYKNADLDDDEDEDQDYLTQGAFVAKIMIAGGDMKRFEELTNAQTTVIKEAIVEASKTRVKSKDHQQLLPSDVSVALKELALKQEIESRKLEFTEMADAIKSYTMGFYGKMFDGYVDNTEDFEIEVLDIGVLGTNKEYNDAFILAWVGLLNRLEVISEKTKASGIERDTLLVNDEAHITMEIPMMSDVLSRKSKVFRKQAIWMILATQDLDDIPPSAKKIVGMMEWLMFMSMNKDELSKLENFVDLDDEQRNLIMSTKGDSKNYKEGVLFSEAFKPQIFRNIPPALILAVGQTERKERAKRAELGKLHNVTDETQISRLVAEDMREKRKLALGEKR